MAVSQILNKLKPSADGNQEQDPSNDIVKSAFKRLGIDLEGLAVEEQKKVSEAEARRERYERKKAAQEAFEKRIRDETNQKLSAGGMVAYINQKPVKSLEGLVCPHCGAHSANSDGYLRGYWEDYMKRTPVIRFIAMAGIRVIHEPIICRSCKEHFTLTAHLVWQPE